MKGVRGAGLKEGILLALLLYLETACAGGMGEGRSLPVLEKEAHGALVRGELTKALRLDRQALALSPGDAILLNNLAVVEDRLGKEEKALQILEEANRKSPRDPKILLNLARIELKIGREGEAFRTAGKIVAMDQWPEGFRTLMGKIDIDLSRYGEAHIYLHEALERHPGNPLILTYLGIVHYRLGELSDAKNNFREALTRHPPPRLRGTLEKLMKAPDRVLGPAPSRSLVEEGSPQKKAKGSP